MDLEDFLKRFVEGYLFHDLDNMATLTVPAGQDDGAAGYPMISTTASGIELLGGLLSQQPFSTGNSSGNAYFLDYWNRCLSVTNSDYQNLGELFRKLVRHGLAHTFLAKHGILVTKRNPAIHAPTFKIDTTRQELIIDCVDFYNDFKRSYQEHIQPVVFSGQSSSLTTKEAMQERLNEMVTLYEADSQKSFADYISRMPTQTTTTTTSTARASGASLPLGPTTFTPSIPASGVSSEAFATATFSGMVNKKKSQK
jgi:hypothetical protein